MKWGRGREYGRVGVRQGYSMGREEAYGEREDVEGMVEAGKGMLRELQWEEKGSTAGRGREKRGKWPQRELWKTCLVKSGS